MAVNKRSALLNIIVINLSTNLVYKEDAWSISGRVLPVFLGAYFTFLKSDKWKQKEEVNILKAWKDIISGRNSLFEDSWSALLGASKIDKETLTTKNSAEMVKIEKHSHHQYDNIRKGIAEWLPQWWQNATADC